MHRMKQIAAFITLILLSGCTDGAPTGSAASEATDLQVLTGHGQVAMVGAQVVNSPRIVVRDADGRPMQGQIVHFEVVAGGGTVGPSGAVTTDESGVAALDRWTLGTEPGMNQVRASLNGAHRDLEAILEASARPGRAVDAHSILTLVEPESPASGTSVPAVFRFEARDAYGNLVPGEAVHFSMGPEAKGSLKAAPWTTDASGVVEAQVRSRTAGAVEITVRSGHQGQGAILASDVVNFLPGAATGAESSLVLETSGRLEANESDSARVMLTLRDAHGNVRYGGGDPVHFESEQGIIGTPTDHGDGSYSTWVRSSRSGWVHVTARVGEGSEATQVGSLPVRFRAGAPDAETSELRVEGDGEVHADGSDLAQLQVHLRDGRGNPIETGPVDLTLESDHGELGEITRASDGIYQAELSTTTAGPVVVRAWLGSPGEGSLIGSREVVFHPAPADAGASTVAMQGNDAPVADGEDRARIVVSLRDAQGNARPTGEDRVEFSAEHGEVTYLGGTTNGSVVALVRTTRAGPNRVTARLVSGEVIGHVDVPFHPGPPMHMEVLDEDDLHGRALRALDGPLSIRVTDSHGNPVPGVALHFTTEGENGSFADGGHVVTDASGIAQATWTLGIAGHSQTASVTADAVAGGTTLVHATVAPPTLAAAASWTAQGPSAGVATFEGDGIRLTWDSNAFSASWTYRFTPEDSGALALDWALRACHSWHQSRGNWRIQVTGPSGTVTHNLNSGGGCWRTRDGSVDLEVYAGYEVRVLVSGSHYDGTYRLDGRLDLTPR